GVRPHKYKKIKRTHEEVIFASFHDDSGQAADARELNKAPYKEEVEALRVTLSREERLLHVLADEIAKVKIEHERASHALAQAQAALDAASLIYRTADTMLQGLDAQHNQLLQNVAEKRATLHPIRRVPAELWADIFTRWVDEEEQVRVSRLDSQLPTELHVPATLIAASVSHFWRKTALSTPALWRYITISNRPLADIKAHVYEWASRSSPKVVSLTLWVAGRDGWTKDLQPPSTTLDGLRLALFYLKAVQVFSSIVSDARVKLSNLSEVWIEFIEPPESGSIIVPDRTFQVSTSGSEFHLLKWFAAPPSQAPPQPDPSESLVELTRWTEKPSSSQNRARHPPDRSKTTHPNIPQGAIVDYPRLKSLSLCPRWMSACNEDLAQVMTLPALRILRLISCQVAPLAGREAEAISRFIADVAPAVETIHFNLRGELVHPQIFQIRAAISRLEFKDTEIAIDTLELLTKPTDGGPTTMSRWLMPHLSSIHFEDCDLAPELDRVLAQLVETRAEASPYIRPNVNTRLERINVRRNSVNSWTYPVVW
ncbi:7720_t:CDS:2, partial [Acaulospora colombiana]